MATDALRILIADDNASDRLILRTLLQREGHSVIEAENGRLAVQQFLTEQPDIVLLDVLMPELDGYEAAIQIKMMAGSRLVPIIFLTALTDVAALARCLEVGGDDFLTKPYQKLILQAKLRAFTRMQQLYDTVSRQRDEIHFHTERLVREQQLAKILFDNIAHPGCLDAPTIRYQLSPMYIFNGDVLLAAEKPAGGLHVLLGDFTGHGLPAAIGAMPVSEIFYGMTQKGFSLVDILTEINQRLKEILPTGVFCCAISADIDFRSGMLELWNGGMPDAFLARSGRGILTRFSSQHLPMGVVGRDRFRPQVQRAIFSPEDRLLLTSDGVIETSNANGEMFGSERLEQAVATTAEGDSFFAAVQRALELFGSGAAPRDDVSMVEVELRPLSAPEHAPSSPRPTRTGPLDWRFEYELRTQSLQQFDPLPLLLQVLMEQPALRPHRGRVFTILAELYSNALDHGILQLDSSLKNSPEGFAEYYRLRQSRLQQLAEGSIRLVFEHQPRTHGGRLLLRVEDSGPGFDWQRWQASQVPGNGYGGRGLALLANLCQSLQFEGRGNIVAASYDWLLAED
ncbi:SpoIIE family protein phosphatase [Permianibacter fluminis]|uniref:SpoIIE family protein phosphatase n=1 Tax=Permianibacter fluminis TaxID=2738515 RepID=UPI0038B3A94E